MSSNYLDIKSELAKAKNLGSSSHGSEHWLMQRFSAILLLVLLTWLVCFVLRASTLNYKEVVEMIKHPVNFIPAMLFLTIGIYHGKLGLQVVIEDYISNLCIRNGLIISLKLYSFVTIFVLIAASVYFIALG